MAPRVSSSVSEGHLLESSFQQHYMAVGARWVIGIMSWPVKLLMTSLYICTPYAPSKCYLLNTIPFKILVYGLVSGMWNDMYDE